MASKRKARKGLLPQTRAVRWLQSGGWIADPAERKIGLLSKDWGGFADIVAVMPETTQVLLVQVTSNAHFADRVWKCLDNKNAQRIIQSMPLIHIEVWGYKSSDAYKASWDDDKLSDYYRPYRTKRLILPHLQEHLAARGALDG